MNFIHFKAAQIPMPQNESRKFCAALLKALRRFVEQFCKLFETTCKVVLHPGIFISGNRLRKSALNHLRNLLDDFRICQRHNIAHIRFVGDSAEYPPHDLA